MGLAMLEPHDPAVLNPELPRRTASPRNDAKSFC